MYLLMDGNGLDISGGASMVHDKPGIGLEKLVAEIQAQFDAGAQVTHDERLVDRLGQTRQFDVVIRGMFSGQEILGVIECKDWKRKVGTPHVEAFVTKSQDVNAAFKVIVSRKGFTRHAIDKARHYGVQTFSLLPEEGAKTGFIVGLKWHANIYRWGVVQINLHFVAGQEDLSPYNAGALSIGGKRILDGITNYLYENYLGNMEEGWVVDKVVQFSSPRYIQLDYDRSCLCAGFSFKVNRIIDKREKLIGMSGAGFYDWQTQHAKIPPATTIVSHPIPFDVLSWPERNSDERDGSFLNLTLVSEMVQFDKVDGALNFDDL